MEPIVLTVNSFRHRNRPFARSGHTVRNFTLGREFHSGTFRTKESRAGLVRVPLFWKSHCATCIPAKLIPYHVTGSCKGSICEGNTVWQLLNNSAIAKEIAIELTTGLNWFMQSLSYYNISAIQLKTKQINRKVNKYNNNTLEKLLLSDWLR